MDKKIQKLFSAALIFLIAISIYFIHSHRSLEKEIGMRYISLYSNINNSINLIKEDVFLLELVDADDYSELLLKIEKINSLGLISYSLPTNVIFYLLRDIETDLINITQNDGSMEEKNKKFEVVNKKFEVLGQILEIIDKQMDIEKPHIFFKEVNSSDSKTSEAIREIFNDYNKLTER